MSSTPCDHPLDNVFWSALTGAQSHLALGDARVRRFRPEFALFAGMAESGAAGLAALAELMRAGDVVALADRVDIEPGPRLEVVERKNLVQMIGAATGAVEDAGRYVALGGDDGPQMTALAQRTAPGPWFARTAELGRFVGFKVDGRLVAMVGERLRVAGHTEISAVCCLPEFRGRGLAADLMRLVSRAIVARGETPFLHVLADNASAIALYEKLGLRRRQERRLAILRRQD